MSNDPLVKDVESLLLNKQKSRRRERDPYPIAYSKGLADFDIWDHMFRVSYCKSLTMHQFTEPPALTLDLGCGSGFWAMEAAKRWPNSTIIGFDIADIQPHFDIIEQFKPLSRQIKWVHGNLFDGLPFPSNHFDLVRMVGMGLAIPEDEWQPVLEEVHRVLKPGAPLEIIEEDLLFPSPSSQLQKPKLVTLTRSPSNESPPPRLPKKRSVVFADILSDQTGVSPTSAAVGDTTSPNLKASSKITSFLPSLYTSRQASTATLTAIPSICTELYVEMEHPQNHTRLKTAWEAMLTTRFLSPNLLSVIPFYLTSASFSVKVHSKVLVPLPPNSGVSPSLGSFQSMGSLRHRDRSGGTTVDFQPALTNRSIKTDGFSMRTSLPSMSRPPPPPWGSMHLAKVTSIIKECREAIWSEYKKLYSEDAVNILTRTAFDNEDYSTHPHENVIYKAFEVDWNNWDCDMTDRIGMRKNLLVHAAWALSSSNRDQPPCQTWREKLDGKQDSGNKSAHFLVTAYNPDNYCRSLRAFTATKL